MQNQQTTIEALIANSSNALIGSVDMHGFPQIKAMLAPRLRQGLREFYFTTNTSSRRVGQYRHDDKACLYFFNARSFQGVQLIGTMEVLEDLASKQNIWRDGDELYYPQGVTDPDYCVLKFTATTGRYYSHFHSEDFAVQSQP